MQGQVVLHEWLMVLHARANGCGGLHARNGAEGGFACKGKWFCMNACGLCMQVQMVLHEWLVVLHASANGFS